MWPDLFLQKDPPYVRFPLLRTYVRALGVCLDTGLVELPRHNSRQVELAEKPIKASHRP